MTEHVLNDQGGEVDVTQFWQGSTPEKFASKISEYPETDRLILNMKLAEAKPDFIRDFLSGGPKRLVRIHCTLDEFDKFSNSAMFPKNKDLEWVCD